MKEFSITMSFIWSKRTRGKDWTRKQEKKKLSADDFPVVRAKMKTIQTWES